MTAKRRTTGRGPNLIRHLVVVVAFVAACSGLGARIVYLNVTERDFLKEQGDARSIRAEDVPAEWRNARIVHMAPVAEEIERHVREAPDRAGFVLHRPLPPAFTVSPRVTRGTVICGMSSGVTDG